MEISQFSQFMEQPASTQCVLNGQVAGELEKFYVHTMDRVE